MSSTAYLSEVRGMVRTASWCLLLPAQKMKERPHD